MLSFSDFQMGGSSLEDFQVPYYMGKTPNEKSAKLAAASQSLLTGASRIDYEAMKQKYMDPIGFASFGDDYGAMRDAIWQNFVTGKAPEVLADPNLDDDTRTQMLEATFTLGPALPISSMDALSYQAIHMDAGEDATDESEGFRYRFIDDIRQSNQNKRDRQAAINELNIGKDASFGKQVKDLGEIVVPFAEWNFYNRMVDQLKDMGLPWEDDNTILLGSLKSKLFKTITTLPEDKRAEFTEFILDQVENSPNVILPDGNDLVSLDILNRMLVDNDYSNVEKWFDNITSILDVTGLGAVARSGIKATRGVSKAGQTVRTNRGLQEEAERFSSRAPEDTGPLGREAEEFAARGGEDLGPLGREAGEFQPTPEEIPSSLNAEAQEFQRRVTEATPLEEEANAFKNLKDAEGASMDAVERHALARQARALADNTRSEVAPASPSQIIKDANPESARNVHKAVVADTTDETAEALYGSSRSQALSKDLLPEVEITKGRIPNKVEMGPSTTWHPRLERLQRVAGFPAATSEELSRVAARLVKSAEDLVGMKPHPSSLTVRTAKDGSISYVGRFGPQDGSFTTWGQAVDRAKIAFREYGLNEKDFTPLIRKGDEWVEVQGKVPETGDFSVGVKFNYRFRPEDLEVDEALTYKAGIVGRVVSAMDSAVGYASARAKQGSIVQSVIPPESIIENTIINPAFVAVDRAAQIKKEYVRMFNSFTKEYKKMKPDRRALMNEYIKEANLEGLPLNTTELLNRGFTNAEIETLKQWRRSVDTMWYASNDDRLKVLRSKGYKVFTKDDNTELMGIPASRQAADGKVVYDPLEGTIQRVDKTLGDTLYESGGEVLTFGSPVKIDGRWVDGVMSRNTIEAGYTRGFRDGETVLPYREGYYPVVYDANYFIQMQVTEGGRTFTKTIATAKDQREAAQTLKLLREEHPDTTFLAPVPNRRQAGNILDDDKSWDFLTSSDMTSQRIRGERLGAGGLDLHKINHSNILDPLEAVEKQIHTLSQRTAMREVLLTFKERWTQNYGKYLDIPKDKLNRDRFPDSLSQVVGKEGVPRTIVEDARNHFNYIYSLENGYMSVVDEAYKGTLHHLSNMFGELGVKTGDFGAVAGAVERGLKKTAGRSPTSGIKSLAFKAALSLNPLRQSVIQRGQILLISAINPKYAVSNMVPDLLGLNRARMGMTKDPKYIKLLKEATDSGIMDSVDAHILLRDSALRLADESWMQKVGTSVNKPINFMQKIGFDAAERDNLLAAWLSFREQAIKAGKDLTDQRVKNEILAQARSFTGGMNRAGDMAYSQNSLGIITQFFSFRHKMLMLPVNNKNLTRMQKAQLLATTTALFGIEATALTYALDKVLPYVDEQLRSTIEEGFLSIALNKALTVASGEDQALDWGDLAPAEAYGMGNVLAGLWSSSLIDVIAESPSGGLLFGSNPRVHDAFKTAGRFFNVLNDYQDEDLETRFSDVVIGFASIASGFSAAFRAKYAFETGKKVSTFGNVTDDDISKMEAAGMLIGVQTKKEVGFREAKEILFEGSSPGEKANLEQDIIQWYGELKRHLARRYSSPLEQDYYDRVLSEAWRVFGDDRPGAMNIIFSQMQKDARDNDYDMFNSIVRRMGLMPEKTLREVIYKLPDGDVKDTLTQMLDSKEAAESGD